MARRSYCTDKDSKGEAIVFHYANVANYRTPDGVFILSLHIYAISIGNNG